MMAEEKNVKTIKVKVRRKKLKIKNFLILLCALVIIFFVVNGLCSLKIKNIIVIGNKYISDQTIIETIGIENYPSYFLFNSKKAINKLKDNNMIKEVKISKKNGRKLVIEVTENKMLFSYNNKIVLENKKEIDNNNYSVPILVNRIDDEYYNSFIEAYGSINYDIIKLISEIKYVPNDVDKERFVFTMTDRNVIYMTIPKIDEVNNYLELKAKVGDNKGIFHLDSGRYFEIRKDF